MPGRLMGFLGNSEGLETVDLIVHAGDFTEKAVLDGLKTITGVKAVRRSWT